MIHGHSACRSTATQSKLFDASGESMKLEPSMKNHAALAGGLLAAAFGIMILLSLLGALTSVETISYSKFEELVAQGAVTEVIASRE